jgi:hypothetical protein
MYSKWINSWRDLPVLINQWGSVLRWEMRTRLFLRTAEFYWQEGHTAHASADEALEETYRMLDIYADVAINEAAIPVFKGYKSETERFAGAQITTSIEGMMQDKRALQMATSHYFGQNFSKAFGIQYLDKSNVLQYAETTSWGLSTRLIGAVIMTHGDDQGLILPPRLAPIQVIIVPIFKNDAEKSRVMEVADRVLAELKTAGDRVKVDDRDTVSPGFKFNDWEMRACLFASKSGPRNWKRKRLLWPAGTSQDAKASHLFLGQVSYRLWAGFLSRFRMHSSFAPPHSEMRTFTIQRITTNSSPSSQTGGRSPGGARVNNARRKLRKTQKPPPVSFLGTSPKAAEPASSAVNLPGRRSTLPGHIEGCYVTSWNFVTHMAEFHYVYIPS